MPEIAKKELADCEVSLFEHLLEEMRNTVIHIRERCYSINVFAEGREAFGFCSSDTLEKVRAVFDSYKEETTYDDLYRIAAEEKKAYDEANNQ